MPSIVTKEIFGVGDHSATLWGQEQKLQSLEPGFRVKVILVITDLTSAGFQPSIVYAWRSITEQLILFKAGKSKVTFSFHNAQLPDGTPNALAVDIIDKRWAWNEIEIGIVNGKRVKRSLAEINGFWKALGATGKKYGLEWGGDWKGFPDVAHLQGRKNSELAMVKKDSGLA